MGIHDSTRTRVEPIFDELFARDSTGASWLPPLAALPSRSGDAMRKGLTSALQRCGWGDSEIPLPPPPALLRWLVRNPQLCDEAAHRSTSTSTRLKRDLLLARDPETVEEAIRLLSRLPIPSRAWFVMEGPTWPDVYLENETSIVVIEGKRTEPGPTTHTTWMRVRHQMLRHLDCAWEQRRGREVFGFFIVEGELDNPDPSTAWLAYADAVVRPEALDSSLPHRDPVERTAIARSFLGVTTWQRVCSDFGIRWETLPDAT